MASKSIIIGSFVIVVLLGVFGGGVATGILIGGNENVENATTLPISNESTEQEVKIVTAVPEDPDDDEEDDDTERSISPRKFNEGNITKYIIKYINVARVNGSANITGGSMNTSANYTVTQSNGTLSADMVNTTANLSFSGGLEPLRTGTTNAERLQNMAASHSDAMAREGQLAHTVNNISTVDRYKQYELYQRCEINVENNYVLRPDSENFELIGLTVAGQEYTPSDRLAGWGINETENSTKARVQFNANDKQVARALVINWLDGAGKSHPALFEDTSEIGVSVSLTSTGSVYATVNTCGN
jgi:uncharacterized protein YkwD